MSDQEDHEYPVGYGKPPKSGQFKKGQSGNPKGRPKGSLDYTTYVQQMLSAQVTVTESGKPQGGYAGDRESPVAGHGYG